MNVNVEGEKRYEEVFGDTFALYSHKEMVHFIEPFKIRFERNKLNPKSIFKGKRCFDGGCGNGRGTLFMLIHGAEHVTCYDFSEKNILSTKSFVEDFGFSNITLQQGTLERIPFADAQFDFVWCNGVIMHTQHPNQCLSEIARILKVGGQSWLYIYGAGGIYWRIIYHLRELVQDIKIQEAMSALKLFRYSTRYVAEFIDDWYATYLRTYTHADLSKRLADIGFETPQLLRAGTDYDTSHRINIFWTDYEKELMGEGDLRYLLTKKHHAQVHEHLLNEREYGSQYAWPSVITNTIDSLFKTVSSITANDIFVKVAVAAHIQRELRILLEKKTPFELSEIVNIVQSVIEFVKQIRTSFS